MFTNWTILAEFHRFKQSNHFQSLVRLFGSSFRWGILRRVNVNLVPTSCTQRDIVDGDTFCLIFSADCSSCSEGTAHHAEICKRQIVHCGCVGGVIDSNSETESSELNSNSASVSYIHLRAITLWKGMNLTFTPNSRTCIWINHCPLQCFIAKEKKIFLHSIIRLGYK